MSTALKIALAAGGAWLLVGAGLIVLFGMLEDA